MPRLYSSNLGGGSSGGVTILAGGFVAINSATQNFTVSFSSDLGTTNYVVNFSLENNVDADPIYLTGIITAKNTNGFDMELSAPTDSANYEINYMVCTPI